MRVVFMGTPDFAVGTLEALMESNHQVVGVVTQPDKPKGRGKALAFTPVKEAALRHEIPVYQPVKVREAAFLQTLQELDPDVIIVVAFGQLIPKSILELPRYGCINVHASLLPKYRGAAPIQWAIIDGEAESGVTIMQMDEGLDTGDMICKVVLPISKEETGGSLFEKLSIAGAKLLVETLQSIEDGTAVLEKQPKESTTAYAKMIQKNFGLLDFTKPAFQLERLVRGLNPWPSAYTHLKGKTLKVWNAELQDGTKGETGCVVGVSKEGIEVQTTEGIFVIKELQLEGKKRMEVDAFLRGNQIEVGTLLN